MTVPVTSMGDIAFLLTIFFMVCSNFAKEAGIQWTAASAPGLRVLQESKISVSIDKDGVVRLQGQVVPDAASVETGVMALMQLRTGPDAKMVMLKCDKGVDKAVFEPVIGALARAGAMIVAVGEERAAAPQ